MRKLRSLAVAAVGAGILSLSASPAPTYDPLHAAQNYLASAGFTAPEGSTIGYGTAEDMPKNALGHTDSATGDIAINGEYVDNFISHFPTDPAQDILIYASVLFHEYQHTDDYGDPSEDGEDGYNNGFCQHMSVIAAQAEFMCEGIGGLAASGGALDGACTFHQDQASAWNTNLDRIQSECGDQHASKIWRCNACDS